MIGPSELRVLVHDRQLIPLLAAMAVLPLFAAYGDAQMDNPLGSAFLTVRVSNIHLLLVAVGGVLATRSTLDGSVGLRPSRRQQTFWHAVSLTAFAGAWLVHFGHDGTPWALLCSTAVCLLVPLALGAGWGLPGALVGIFLAFAWLVLSPSADLIRLVPLGCIGALPSQAILACLLAAAAFAISSLRGRISRR